MSQYYKFWMHPPEGAIVGAPLDVYCFGFIVREALCGRSPCSIVDNTLTRTRSMTRQLHNTADTTADEHETQRANDVSLSSLSSSRLRVVCAPRESIDELTRLTAAFLALDATAPLIAQARLAAQLAIDCLGGTLFLCMCLVVCICSVLTTFVVDVDRRPSFQQAQQRLHTISEQVNQLSSGVGVPTADLQHQTALNKRRVRLAYKRKL
jgi:hypothetical protein